MSLKKKAAAAVVVAGVATGGGVAWAGWNSTVATGGSNAPGSAKTMKIAASLAAHAGDADLFPGSKGKVYFTFQNNAPFPVTIDKVTVGTILNPSGCAGATNVLTNALGTTGYLPGTVVAAGGSTNVAVPDAVLLSTAADNGCQDISFAVPVTVEYSQKLP